MVKRAREGALAAGALLVSLLAVEGAARVWVAVRWPEGQAHMLTHETEVRGRFAADPWSGYGLTPGYRSERYNHNSRAFRGPELAVERTAGVARVAVVGASTVYGPRVKDGETASARLQQLLEASGTRAEVINGGVPGWTTFETVRSLEHRVLPLHPDVVVIMDGRNDSFPELWRGYRDDYSHYRDPAWVMKSTNRRWKRIFRISYLVMGLMHRQERFGFSSGAENPIYGSIRWENRPTHDEARRFASEERRYRGFAENVRRAIALARAAGASPVIATVPYRQTVEFRSGNLDRTFEPMVAISVATNHRVLREIAAETGAPLVDTPDLWTEEYLGDDCHFTANGERAFAARLLPVVAGLLSQRQASASAQ